MNQIWDSIEGFFGYLNGLPPTLLDLARLSFWLFFWGFVFAILERIFYLHKQKFFRKDFFTDIAFYFLNSYLPGYILSFILFFAIAPVARHLVPHAVISFMASLPIVVRGVLALLIGELGYYWAHRWAHEVPFLWRFHSVHHAPTEIDWLVNIHSHPLDMVFTRTCMYILLFAVGLAAPISTKEIDPVAVLILTVLPMWSFFVHGNLRWRLGWINRIVVTPHFHHWHHTADEHINKNYGSMIPLWDIVFKSAYLPQEWPPVYGVHEPMETGLVGQLAHPFVPQNAPGQSQGD